MILIIIVDSITFGSSRSVELTISSGVFIAVPSNTLVEYTFSVNCGEWSLISVSVIMTMVVSFLSGYAPELIPMIVRTKLSFSSRS